MVFHWQKSRSVDITLNKHTYLHHNMTNFYLHRYGVTEEEVQIAINDDGVLFNHFDFDVGRYKPNNPYPLLIDFFSLF
jgi:hypothetical protein